MTNLAYIHQRLHERTPQLRAAGHNAAVAAILCPDDHDEVQLLFIERARVSGDPWSGHIAFPGGRIEAQDTSLRAAAERETLEEIGLDLSNGQYLGRLDDLCGTTLPVQVAAFVYATEKNCPLKPNEEVQQAFWTPFATFCDPQRQCIYEAGGNYRSQPAIDLLGPTRPLLWGITYRFTAQLAALADHPLPITACTDKEKP